jgi:hypothetical protein
MLTSNRSVRRGPVLRCLLVWGIAVLILALGSVVMSGGSARADDETAYASWIGVWVVFEDGKAKCTLTIGQSRRGLYASYTPGNGAAGARVSEGILDLKWKQDGNLSGRAQLKLSEDGKSFTGTSRTDGQTEEHSWRAFKVLAFTGVWKGAFGRDTNLTLTLQQTGYEVTGHAESIGVELGKVVKTLYYIQKGKVTDKKLKFQIIGANTAVNSIGEVTISDDGKTIHGTFRGMNMGAGYIGPVPVEAGGKAAPR